MKIQKYFRVFIVTILLIFLNPLIIIDKANARPGGGSSFHSSGSRSSSSRSFSGSKSYGSRYHSYKVNLDGDGAIGLLIVFVVFGGIIFFLILVSKQHKNVGLISNESPAARGKSANKIDKGIEELKSRDPDFSKILFLEFVNSLYNKLYNYQGKPEIRTISPFISQAEIKKGIDNRGINIIEIVIGSIIISSVISSQESDSIVVDIDANYTLNKLGTSTRYLVLERWVFNRSKGATSKAPEVMRSVSCPNCGGSANFTDAGECPYCNTFINKGEMQWVLADRIEINKAAFSTDGLGTDVQEEGTNNPTIKQDFLNNKIQEFKNLHKLENWDKYWEVFQKNIAGKYFMEIYKSWSENKLQNVRFVLSDRLYESFNFWIKNYKEKNLVNKLDSIKIEKVELARIDLDKYYESFTVRIFASCFDYVINSSGKVIGGSNRKKREFSEYWTFICRAGSETADNQASIKNCPNCGASSDEIGQAGECGYCGSKITTGDFSWVLTLITQDEVYRG